MKPLKEKVLPLIISELQEDIGAGDITSHLIFEKDEARTASIIAKQDCVLAGIDVCGWIFDVIDEKIIFKPLCKDGDRIKNGKKIAFVKGSIRNILAAERTVLNFLSRLSGVATMTAKFVDKIEGTKSRIFGTRKTIPGWRILDKYAVRMGGGNNHRMGLWEWILIKDNHLDAAGMKREKIIKEVVLKAKDKQYKNVEIEVEDLRQFKAALEAGADIIMLDNMKAEDVRKAVKIRDACDKGHRTKTSLEVSGGIKLENILKFAKTGVDRISVGALTHSAPSIDFSLVCHPAP